MLDKLIELDRSATLALNTMATSGSDPFWRLMSATKPWIPLYIAIIALLIWKLGWKRGLILIVAIILGDICADQMCNLVKNSVCRLRPCCDREMISGGLRILQKVNNSHSFGFFSAHAATTFALAFGSSIAITMAKKRRWIELSFTIFIFLWSSLVAISRIFVGKHFIGDIIFGALAGVLISYIWIVLARWLISYMEKKGAIATE